MRRRDPRLDRGGQEGRPQRRRQAHPRLAPPAGPRARERRLDAVSLRARRHFAFSTSVFSPPGATIFYFLPPHPHAQPVMMSRAIALVLLNFMPTTAFIAEPPLPTPRLPARSPLTQDRDLTHLTPPRPSQGPQALPKPRAGHAHARRVARPLCWPSSADFLPQVCRPFHHHHHHHLLLDD